MTKPVYAKREPISPISRLAHTRLEKYLMEQEFVVYSTKHQVLVGKTLYSIAAVTNQGRFLFYMQRGLIFKSDHLEEIPLYAVTRIHLVETGMLRKRIELRLDEWAITGERTDMIKLYRHMKDVQSKLVNEE